MRVPGVRGVAVGAVCFLLGSWAAAAAPAGSGSRARADESPACECGDGLRGVEARLAALERRLAVVEGRTASVPGAAFVRVGRMSETLPQAPPAPEWVRVGRVRPAWQPPATSDRADR